LALTEWNIDVFRMINNLGKHYPELNPLVIFFAEYMEFLLILIVLGFWFSRKQQNKVMVICAGGSFILAEIIGKLAGALHYHEQPFAELANVSKLIEKTVDNSFPSDHTILFFTFCLTFWLFKRGWGFLWVLLAALVGLSRIWVGVHYPVDVMVGALISVLSAAVVYMILPKMALLKTVIEIYEKGEALLLPGKNKTRNY
jgi:undecaprenyl-diphosphatase